MEDRALIAFVLALALTAAVTPLVARLARRVGALDPVQERGLASEPTPLLGGLAILAGVLVAGALLLPATTEMRGILVAALLITIVGLLDDIYDLPPQLKLLGQVAAGLICVLSGVRVDDFTFPFVGRVDLGDLGGPLTLIGLVAGHERRQLLRRRRRPRRRRLRDLGDRLLGHRLRPARGRRRHPRRLHRRRRARLPRPQLPPRVGLHGRLGLEPPRPVARRA